MRCLIFRLSNLISKMAVGGPLFGSSSSGRSQAKSSLVEFRAGKMTFNTTTKMVSPDKRKGMLMVTQSDDQLMHLQWKDRTSGTVEDDLILMPDDVEFKPVPACTTGRVFVLKFKGNDKKMFFWMQEPKSDKDEEFCKKVNDFLNNPPPPGSSRSGGASGGGLPGNLDFNNLGDSELQSLLSNMDQRQLMQLFGGSLGGSGGNMSSLSSLLGGGSGGRSRQAAGSGSTRQRNPADVQAPPSASGGGDRSSGAPATVPVPAPAPGGAGAAGSNPAIQLSDLQSILSNMQVPASEGGGQAVDLATAMTGEAMQPLLQNQEFLDKVNANHLSYSIYSHIF